MWFKFTFPIRCTRDFKSLLSHVFMSYSLQLLKLIVCVRIIYRTFFNIHQCIYFDYLLPNCQQNLFKDINTCV